MNPPAAPPSTTDPDEPPVSIQRQTLVWIGALLLHYGHVVEVPAAPLGNHELFVRKKQFRRIRVSLRDDLDLSSPRTIVETVSALEPKFPDAVVIAKRGVTDMRLIQVVPVQTTRDKWISEGRHYTVPTEHLVSFRALDAWLKKLP